MSDRERDELVKLVKFLIMQHGYKHESVCHVLKIIWRKLDPEMTG